MLHLFSDEPAAAPRDPTAVYANNELDLNEIEVYGFDYDYTLASYKQSLHFLIYQLGRDALVRDQKVSLLYHAVCWGTIEMLFVYTHSQTCLGVASSHSI